MHYEEMAARLTEAHQDDVESVFLDLAQALRDGAGYVLIVLNPGGIKVTPGEVSGSSQETIRVKTAMRTLMQQINHSYSGRAHGSSS